MFEDVLGPVRTELREVKSEIEGLGRRVDDLEARLEESVLKLNNHAAVSEIWTHALIARIGSSEEMAALASDTFGAAREGRPLDEIREMVREALSQKGEED